MTKPELINSIHIGLFGAVSKTDIELVLDALPNAIAEGVKTGEKVSVPNLGRFYASQRAARIGRNPQTGAEVQIEAKVTPKFAASKWFKEKVAG
jgi:DNA-binding protein HU-beta